MATFLTRKQFQDRMNAVNRAHGEGRTSEYYCSESKASAIFIDGEDDEAHMEWIAAHPDAVLLKR
jgi:hypothetical protein